MSTEPLNIVGIYRSQEPAEFAPDFDDAAVLRKHFAGQDPVLLLIQSTPFPVGAFFFTEMEQPEPSPRILFPLVPGRSSSLDPPAQNADLESASAAARPLPVSSDVETPGADYDRLYLSVYRDGRSGSRVWRKLALAAILVIVLGALTYWIYTYVPLSGPQPITSAPPAPVTPVRPTVPVSTALALRAWAAGGELYVGWNPDSPLVQSADRGVLSIRNGSEVRKVDLDPVLLRVGGFKAAGRSGDIEVSLQLAAGTHELSETVRLPAERAETTKPAAEPVPQRKPPVEAARREQVEAYFEPVLPAPGHAETGERESRTSDQTASAPSGLPTESSVKPAESPVKPTDSPAELPEASSRSAEPSVAPSPPGRKEQGSAPSAAPAPAPDRGSRFGRSPELWQGASETPPAADSSRTPTQVQPLFPEPPRTNPIPVSPQMSPSGPALLPPVPATQVRPDFPRHLVSQLTEPVRIRVKLSVDEKGRVTSAESLTQGDRLVEALSALARDAARRWRFAPARIGSREVAGETVVEFEFKPR
jgi:TonB family protein